MLTNYFPINTPDMLEYFRETDLEDDGLLIGPPPPAMVAEAESANEAERFEEVQNLWYIIIQ